VITGGQRNDGAMLVEVLADIRVPRTGPGRARTRPDVVIADRAYTSGVNRRMLAARHIKAVIPQKTEEDRRDRRPQTHGLGRRSTTGPARSDLQAAQRRRTLLRPDQAMARPGYPHDKLAIIYRAAVVLSACIVWARI
jgi:hypothetical protein